MHEDKNKKNSCIHQKPTSSKTINLIVKLIASSQQIRNDQLMKLFDSLNHHYKQLSSNNVQYYSINELRSLQDVASTLQLPRFHLVQVDLSDDLHVKLLKGHLLLQIVVKQLLVGRVESEPWRHTTTRCCHQLPSNFSFKYFQADRLTHKLASSSEFVELFVLRMNQSFTWEWCNGD